MSIATTSTRHGRRRISRLIAAGLLLVSLAVLAACGGGDDSSANETTTVSATGYQVSTPEGWKREKSPSDFNAAGFKPDAVLVGERIDGFRPNVTVVRETSLASSVTTEQYVESARRLLSDPRALEASGLDAADAADIGAPKPASLGDDKALSVQYDRNVKGKHVRLRQVIAVREGVAYTVTYSAGADHFEKNLDDFDAILDSWRWS